MWKLLIIAGLIMMGCSKESSLQDQPPAAIQGETKTDSQQEPKKDEDVDSVKEGFQETGKGFKKAGTEMEKGFKKAGTEIKEFFVGEDKDKDD